MINELEKLGFSKREAQVYIAITEIGRGTVSKIANISGVNRITCYDIISDLIKMGLVSEVMDTKKKMFMAEPPEKLSLLWEEKYKKSAEEAKSAKQLAIALRKISKGPKSRPHLQFFEGTEGIKSLYENTLFSKEYIRSFQSTDSLESFDKTYLHGYYGRRAKKKVFIQAILNDTPEAYEYKRESSKLYREIRIVPKNKMDVIPEIYIYENKVAIFSLEEKFAALIESTDTANAFKKLYDLAWERAGEYEKSRA